MASSNLEEDQPERPEPSQIARDRSLKETNSKYKTRETSDVVFGLVLCFLFLIKPKVRKSGIIFKSEHNFEHNLEKIGHC